MKKHKIKAHLRNNAKTPYPKDFVAIVEYEPMMCLGELCDYAVENAEVDFEPGDLEECAKVVLDAAVQRVLDGYEVDLGAFSLRLRVRGGFYDESEKFNPLKHSLRVRLEPGKTLLDELGGVDVEMTGKKGEPCRIDWIENIRTRNIDGSQLQGDLLKVCGYGIHVIGGDEKVGVYFVNVDGGEEEKLGKDDLIINHKDEMVIRIPVGLARGRYRVKIATQYDVSQNAVLDRLLETLSRTVLNVDGGSGSPEITGLGN